MDLGIAGKVALVAGGSRAIGLTPFLDIFDSFSQTFF
jgi:hypothetical protein